MWPINSGRAGRPTTLINLLCIDVFNQAITIRDMRHISKESRFHELLAELLLHSPEQPTWAALHDFLENLPRIHFAAILTRPTPYLNRRQANLVAAMIEYAAHRKGVRPPSWTADITPLDLPFFGSSLISLRLHLLLHSPVEFRRRNLFVDSSIGDRV